MREFAVAVIEDDRTLGAKCAVMLSDEVRELAERGDDEALRSVGQLVLHAVKQCETFGEDS